jgi:membrane-bound serine protease (ClpP class)
MDTSRFQTLTFGLLAWAGLVVGHAIADVRPPSPGHVYVVPVDGVIDLGLAPFIARVLEQAEADRAAAVILDINTFGGRVDAAVVIRDALLNAKVPTVAFVNKRAISAGALIALATDTIVMADGGTIGAATPVQGGLPGAAAQPVEEKTVSYLRKEFRATAEARSRPPALAEAMVDADVQVDGIIEKGKLLTLTTDEALAAGFVEHRADTLEKLLGIAGLGGAEVRRTAPTWAESVVRFLTHPVVSSLLITIALLGIITEIRTPGFGVPGALGVLALGLFFYGHWIVQLAGLEELLLVGGGVTLLLIEVFLVPGFGILGLLGIVAILSGLGMALFGPGATAGVVVTAITRVMASLLVAIAAALLMLRVLPKLPFGRRLILADGLAADAGCASAPVSDAQWLGRRGVAVTALRPAGIVTIDGERLDAVSDGEFLDASTAIEVSKVDGNRIVVRRSPST